MENCILNKEMKKIISKEVSHNRADLYIDLGIIKSHFKDCKKPKTFIWFTRESGTTNMREDFIPIIGSEEHMLFHYWNKRAISCYRLTVNKACNVNLYGSIEKIDLAKYIKNVLANEKKYSSIVVKIVTKENKVIEKQCEFCDGYYMKVLNEEKLQTSDISSFRILNYVQ